MLNADLFQMISFFSFADTPLVQPLHSLPDLFSSFFKKGFTYLFLERGEGKEKERETNISVWLPLMRPLLGTKPATQACALTGNQTSDPLVLSLALSALSHTSQGCFLPFAEFLWWCFINPALGPSDLFIWIASSHWFKSGCKWMAPRSYSSIPDFLPQILCLHH